MALAALKGEKTLLELAQQFDVHAGQGPGPANLQDWVEADPTVEDSVAGVGSLMKKMGIEAIYRRPSTSKTAPGHRIYPYLLRDLAVPRPSQVWAMNISYIPMERGGSFSRFHPHPSTLLACFTERQPQL